MTTPSAPARPGSAGGSGASGAIIVVCGLKAEARIAVGPGLTVLAGGGDGASLEVALRAAAAQPASIGGLVSFGIAGGLAPALKPGTCQIGRQVVAMPQGALYDADPAWAARLSTLLGAPLSIVAGVDTPLADPAGKRALYVEYGATLVDMESHIVARVAADLGLPFAVIRVVADTAERALPHAATVGMRPDGKVDLAAVLLSLARDPRQVPGLIRTAFEARAAFAGLFRCRQLLGHDFGLGGGDLVDLRDPLLDMA